jgi:hypothetical protein
MKRWSGETRRRHRRPVQDAIPKSMKGGTQMNRYRDAIKLLRETDVGVKGPFEEAAQTIILLR